MIPTLTRAEDEGKVTRINRSSATGGTRRSPFLTALLTNMPRALGTDRILRHR